MRIIDPHFHLWDLGERANPNLGPDVERDRPVYLAGDYLRHMGRLPAPLELEACVHVETVVGQMEGGFPLDEVAETRFVRDQMAPTGQPFAIVPYAHLARDVRHTEQVLDRHAAEAGERLRGVRMILNHHPGTSPSPGRRWSAATSCAIPSSARASSSSASAASPSTCSATPISSPTRLRPSATSRRRRSSSVTSPPSTTAGIPATWACGRRA